MQQKTIGTPRGIANLAAQGIRRFAGRTDPLALRAIARLRRIAAAAAARAAIASVYTSTTDCAQGQTHHNI